MARCDPAAVGRELMAAQDGIEQLEPTGRCELKGAVDELGMSVEGPGMGPSRRRGPRGGFGPRTLASKTPFFLGERGEHGEPSR